jgi:TIR domain
MKVFLSWSGNFSQRVAEILYNYLPLMLHEVEVFMSKHDLESGGRWTSQLAQELEASNFGVLCLTQENLQSPWMLFEGGALTKHIEGRACGLLLGHLTPADVSSPLSQFQHRVLSTEGFSALLRDINAKLQKPRDPTNLKLIFDNVDREYQAALSSYIGENPMQFRDQIDILEEILGRLKLLQAADRKAVANAVAQPRDRRPKPAPQRPKYQKLLARDWGAHGQARMAKIIGVTEIPSALRRRSAFES